MFISTGIYLISCLQKIEITSQSSGAILTAINLPEGFSIYSLIFFGLIKTGGFESCSNSWLVRSLATYRLQVISSTNQENIFNNSSHKR